MTEADRAALADLLARAFMDQASDASAYAFWNTRSPILWIGGNFNIAAILAAIEPAIRAVIEPAIRADERARAEAEVERLRGLLRRAGAALWETEDDHPVLRDIDDALPPGWLEDKPAHDPVAMDAFMAANPLPKFRIGDRVRKHSGSWWEGKVVGTYSTEDTPEGYNVQLDTMRHGPVQIYPAAALEPAPHWPRTDDWTRDEDTP